MSKNWAICIGINDYYSLKPLNYAMQDAVAMKDFFEQEVGFEEVFYFSDASPEIPTPKGSLRSLPTYANLKRFFRERFAEPFLSVGDNLWFFFAGHGELHGGHDYLMPIDVDPGNVEETALKISDISAYLRNSGADNAVLLLDACRSQGRRAPVGIGTDEQPGMVTIYSCSPRQSSYEIDEIGHGAFTHTLLEGFRLQGGNSCATVQRIDQYLRHQVPLLNERYSKPVQTPYTEVKPLAKNCLILLPERARLEDVQSLKIAAYKAESKNDWDFAQQLWIRVLGASRVDQDAIEGLQRIALKRAKQPSVGESVVSSTTGSREVDMPSEEMQKDIGSEERKRPGNGSFRLGIIGNSNTTQLDQAEVQRWRHERAARTFARFEQKLRNDAIPETEGTQQHMTRTKAGPTVEFEVVRVDAQGKITQRQKKHAVQQQEDLGNGVLLDLVRIPGGRFQMGSPDGQGDDDERPQHEVSVSPFWMGQMPVTQAQWKVVSALPKIERELKAEPSNFKGDERPVERVDWDDAVEFCGRLTQHSGHEYRLPSEAEWEYACRAGTKTLFHFGETLTSEVANYDANYTYGQGSKGKYRQETTEVGDFPANAFGLYDMHGNVWEWCKDVWHGNYADAPTDGSSWMTGGEESGRLVRGGAWLDVPDYCRSAFRNWDARGSRNLNVGFRVVCGSSWTLA